jgi:hypothetical protein
VANGIPRRSVALDAVAVTMSRFRQFKLAPVDASDEEEALTQLWYPVLCGVKAAILKFVTRSVSAIDHRQLSLEQLQSLILIPVRQPFNILEKQDLREQGFDNPNISFKSARARILQTTAIAIRPVGRFGERLARRSCCEQMDLPSSNSSLSQNIVGSY